MTLVSCSSSLYSAEKKTLVTDHADEIRILVRHNTTEYAKKEYCELSQTSSPSERESLAHYQPFAKSKEIIPELNNPQDSDMNEKDPKVLQTEALLHEIELAGRTRSTAQVCRSLKQRILEETSLTGVSYPQENLHTFKNNPKNLIHKKRKRNEIINKATYEELLSHVEGLFQGASFHENIHIAFYSGSNIPDQTYEAIFMITKENMCELYNNSGPYWKWNDDKKRTEMKNENMRYLIAVEKTSGLVQGFLGFTCSEQCRISHVYVHELQVAERIRNKGLGSFLMRSVESLGNKIGMELILLTALSNNKAAIKFYEKLDFSVDEVSPGPCFNITNSKHEILSKLLSRKVLKYPCNIKGCEASFRFQDSLRRHRCNIHNYPWPYRCNESTCGVGLIRAYQYAKHMEYTHGIIPKTNNGRPKGKKRRAIEKAHTVGVARRRTQKDSVSATLDVAHKHSSDWILALKLHEEEKRRLSRFSRINRSQEKQGPLVSNKDVMIGVNYSCDEKSIVPINVPTTKPEAYP